MSAPYSVCPDTSSHERHEWIAAGLRVECPGGPLPEQPWEPGEVDLTQLARYVILLTTDRDLSATAGHSVLGAWSELLGAPDDETALDYAYRLSVAADRDGTRVTAHVAPF